MRTVKETLDAFKIQMHRLSSEATAQADFIHRLYVARFRQITQTTHLADAIEIAQHMGADVQQAFRNIHLDGPGVAVYFTRQDADGITLELGFWFAGMPPMIHKVPTACLTPEQERHIVYQAAVMQ